MTDEEIIRAFGYLYGGGRAQHLRDEGVPDNLAMPPWAETYWLGKQVVKAPVDLWMYQEVIFDLRPDVLLETGTSGGGSAFFFATLFDIIGQGKVITVDKDEYRHLWREHPRITYLVGDSVSDEIVDRMAKEAMGKTMVSLDSLHTYEHVQRELERYSPFVSSSQYMVVEDVFEGLHRTPVQMDWGSRACVEFMAQHQEFVWDRSKEKHLLTSNLWLRRA